MRCSRLACLCVIAVLAVLPIAHVSGQSMAVSVATPGAYFKPKLSKRDLSIISRVLNLGEVENEVVVQLLEGHEAVMRQRREAAEDEVDEIIERAQVLSDIAGAQLPKERDDAFKAESEKLRDAFMDDLKGILSREQAGRWPLVERELRRFHSIGRGRLAGESLDLIRMIDDKYPSSWTNPEIAAALAEYAEAMDSALKARDEAIGETRSSEFESKLDSDLKAAAKLFEESLASRVAVRDINIRYSERISGLLAGEAAEEFRRSVFHSSFPSLVKPTKSEEWIRAAAVLDSLDSDQRTQTSEIMKRYERERWTLLKEMAALYRERQLEMRPARLDPAKSKTKVATTAEGETISFYSSADIKPTPDDPMTKIKQRKLDLDIQTRRKITPLLTDAQREQVRQPASSYFMFEAESIWGL